MNIQKLWAALLGCLGLTRRGAALDAADDEQRAVNAEGESREGSGRAKSRRERSETESRAIAKIEATGGHVIEWSNGNVHVRFLETPLDDEDLRDLKSIANLTVLRFEGTEITDVGLQHLASATGLVKLSLQNCRRITDAGLQYLASLTRLVSLDLTNCKVGDRALAHLKNLASLKELRLTGPRVSEDAASAFKRARPEVAVVLDNLDVRLDEDHAARAQRRTERDAACRAKLGPQARSFLDVGVRNGLDKGLKALENQDFELAIVHFSEAMTLDPKAVNAYVNRGRAYAGWGAFDKAIEDLSAAIGLNPKLAEAYYSRGIGYAKLGALDRAIADFTKTIALDPNLAQAYTERGTAYQDKNEYGLAITDFTEAIRLNDAVAYFNRGNAYFLQREYDRAINDYTTSIELYPKSADPSGVHGLDCHYFGRVVAYYCRGEQDLAIADFTEAIRLNPNAAKACYCRGVVYREKNEHAKAEADFAKAKELGHAPE